MNKLNPYYLSLEIYRRFRTYPAHINLDFMYTNIGKVDYLKNFKSIHLDYGRVSLKTEFAVDQLLHDKHTYVVTFSKDMAEQIHKRLLMLAEDRGVPIRRTRHPTRVFTADQFCYKLMARDIPKHKVNTVIVDEPGFIKTVDIDNIYHALDLNTLFIFLGRPRK